jgi:hypothetical protein
MVMDDTLPTFSTEKLSVYAWTGRGLMRSKARVDIDRRAVRVEDPAHRLVEVGGGRVVGDRRGREDVELALAVREAERQREAAAGDVSG